MITELTGEIVSTPDGPHPYRVVVRGGGKVILSIDCDDEPGCRKVLDDALRVIEGLNWDVI